jgi:hypothetical protein
VGIDAGPPLGKGRQWLQLLEARLAYGEWPHCGSHVSGWKCVQTTSQRGTSRGLGLNSQAKHAAGCHPVCAFLPIH